MNPPRALIILVGTAAAVIVAAGIGAAAWLIGPAGTALPAVGLFPTYMQSTRLANSISMPGCR